MNYSGYQIESVLRQLRRLRGLFFVGSGAPAGDAVDLSDEARERARTVHLVSPGEPPRTVLGLYDHTRYAPLVERELERRAASFLYAPEAEDEDEAE